MTTVLFACVHNGGRSIAAAALARHLAAELAPGLVVLSAGSAPGDGINPAVAAVLAERGITVDDVPSLLTPETVQASDVVVTMGCGESCPVLPGRRYEDWPLTDPKGLPVEQVRPIVDEVERRVRRLLAGLHP